MKRRTMLAAMAGGAFLAAAPIPRPAGEFGFEVPSGKQVLLTAHRGKAVMMAFFSTTCPHCQDTARMMQRLQNEYGPRGFQALGVCFNEMAKMLTPEFIQHQGLSFPVGYALSDQVLTYLQHPAGEIPYVPMLVFIDKQGVIQGQFTAGADKDFFKDGATQEARSRAMIEKLLGGRATKPMAAPAKKAATKKAS